MTDILIRGLSAEAVTRIESQARSQGLSRNEYLRAETGGRNDPGGCRCAHFG